MNPTRQERKKWRRQLKASLPQPPEIPPREVLIDLQTLDLVDFIEDLQDGLRKLQTECAVLRGIIENARGEATPLNLNDLEKSDD